MVHNTERLEYNIQIPSTTRIIYLLLQRKKYLNSANEMETKGKLQFGQLATNSQDMIGISRNNRGLTCKM